MTQADDFALLEDVKVQLQKNTVLYEDAVGSLRLALRCYGTPESQDFIRGCLPSMVFILLDQHIGHLNDQHRKYVDISLDHAVHLLIKLLEDAKVDYVDLLVALFNKRRTLYKGGPINYWTSSVGAPDIRIRMIETFASRKGFQMLNTLLEERRMPWPGAEAARLLLQAVIDARSFASEQLAMHHCRIYMDLLQNLTEDELKREPTDSVASLMTLIRKMMEPRNRDVFFHFWLALILSYLRSSSLPLRLFAWEQMTDLIEATRRWRPLARRYLVKGAGTPFVNGVYEYVKLPNNEKDCNPQFCKQCDNGVVMTLFRCTMRSKLRWWYISEADHKMPGTDQDIDYYQHKSTLQEEREPAYSGWSTCVGTERCRGVDPAPYVERLEPLVEDGNDEGTCEDELMQWLLQHHIVEDVFGDSMHREIVNRASGVLHFLSAMKALQPSHIAMIWKTSLGQAEAELVDEIYNVLATLLHRLTKDNAVFFCELVRAHIPDATSEVLSLVEKLTAFEFTEIRELQGEEALDALLLLLWDLLQHPSARQHKAYDAISTLFRNTIVADHEDKQQAFLKQCIQLIAKSRDYQSNILPTAATFSPQSPLSVSTSSALASDFNEARAQHALQITHYLLQALTPDVRVHVMVQLTEQEELPELLFGELVAYKDRTARRAGSGRPDAIETVQERVQLRLNVLRYIHTATGAVRLTQESLRRIWRLMTSPAEEQLFLDFLYGCCQTQGVPQMLEPVGFSIEVLEQAFREFFCQATWRELGDRAYICFIDVLYTLQRRKCEKVSSIGLETLWRIALTARNEAVTTTAIKELLRVYGGGGNPGYGNLEQGSFLRQIFEQLGSCRAELQKPESATPGDLAEISLKAERCLKLIHDAVSAAHDNSLLTTPTDSLPHAIRGQGGRRAMLIEPKRMPHAPQSFGSRHPLPKLDCFTVHMHPFESVAVLRRRVAAQLNQPVSQVRLVITGRNPGNLRDEQRIENVVLEEGSNIMAFLTPKPVSGLQQPHMSFHANSNGLNGTAGSLPWLSSRVSDDTRAGAGTHISVSNRIAQEDEYCSVLFDLLECAGTEQRFSKIIWHILSAIPTQKHALEMVKRAACPSPPASSAPSLDMNGLTRTSRSSPIPEVRWASLMLSASWHRNVYYLQIIDILLQPTQDYLMATPIKPADFKAAFLRTGGLTQVLDVLMQLQDASLSQGKATSVTLRIVRFLLFGGTSEGPGANRGKRKGSTFDSTGDGTAMSVCAGAEDGGISAAEVLGGLKKVQILLTRLMQMALQSHEANALVSDSWETTVNALGMIQRLFEQDTSGELVTTFVLSPIAEPLVVSLLLRERHPAVQGQMRELVLSTANPKMTRHVFCWCIDALETLDLNCSACREYFQVLQENTRRCQKACRPTTSPRQAVQENLSPPHMDTDRDRALLRTLTTKVTRCLAGFPRAADQPEQRNHALQGYLGLLQELVQLDPKGTLLAGTGFEDLIDRVFSDLLFAMPTVTARDNRPICALTDPVSRQVALSTLLARVSQSAAEMDKLVARLSTFIEVAAQGLSSRWNYECSYDAKTNLHQYVGLRNQGCTCYMNSLLQQLFMIPSIRDAVLRAPQRRRRSVPFQEVALCDLVDMRILAEMKDGRRIEGLVQSVDCEQKQCTVRCEDDSDHSIPLCEDVHKEKGIVRLSVIPPPCASNPRVTMEMEATQKLLEQLQRTFCYLQSSEKRAFDPRPLVETCKCLKLQYSVYQQNDASEFCDKLLDKLEAALKGTPQAAELKRCFGGKLVYQKIPQGCEHRADRKETFIKIELIIRGKESVEESLAAFVEGELMDGDNKVECEGCETKKATTRRVCIEELPNVLILHLKRFDLDFTTFETVKLNNRCAFPMRLSLKPYTREGIEEAAQRQQAEDADATGMADSSTNEQTSPASSMSSRTTSPLTTSRSAQSTIRHSEGEPFKVPMSLEDADYEYDLKGVVIHAGVAQGGHYYSYIKDRNLPDTWYKFDDEDVSVFNPAHIEAQCFGGTVTKSTNWQGVQSRVEQDRMSNALMLWYEKVRQKVPDKQGPDQRQKPTVREQDGTFKQEDAMDVDGDVQKPANGGMTQSGDASLSPQQQEEENILKLDFVMGPTGREVFEDEVWKANMQFTYCRYLCDGPLHTFICNLLALVFHHLTPPQVSESAATLPHPAPPTPTSLSSPPQATPPTFPTSPSDSDSPLPWERPPRHPTTPLPRANSTSPLPWDPQSPEPPLPLSLPLDPTLIECRLEIAALGLQFLFNVVLHLRDRPGLHRWLNLFRQAFRVDAAIAPWFVELLTGPKGKHWLQIHLLESEDSTARRFAQQLIAAALSELKTRSEEVAVLRREDYSPEEAGRESRGALILNALIDLLVRADEGWQLTDYIFLLLRDLAKTSEVIREYLVRADLLIRLVAFACDPEVLPLEVQRLNLPSWTMVEGGTVDEAEYLFLLELVATLVGAAAGPCTDLLEEPGPEHVGANDYKFTPAARAAFEQIWASVGGEGMTLHSLWHYFEHTIERGQSQFAYKNILAKYDTTTDGRLSKEGFLTFYRDEAVWAPRTVWRDLDRLDFRSDLTRAESSSDFDLDLARLPPLRLPPLSEQMLCLIPFHIRMISCSYKDTSRILQRLCFNNHRTSRQLLAEALQHLHENIRQRLAQQAQPASTTPLYKILRVLLGVRDQLRQDRLMEAIWHSSLGLASLPHTHLRYWQTAFRRQRLQSDAVSQGELARIYIDEFLRPMIQTCQHFRHALDSDEDRRPQLYAWFELYLRLQGGLPMQSPYMSSYGYRNGFVTADMDQSDEETEISTLVVEDAGYDQVNGKYRYQPRFRNMGSVWVRHYVDASSDGVLYCLWRDRSEGKVKWILSELPHDAKELGANDQDLYEAEEDDNEDNTLGPPRKGWKIVAREEASEVKKYEPPPRIHKVQGDEGSEEDMEAGAYSDTAQPSEPSTSRNASPSGRQASDEEEGEELETSMEEQGQDDCRRWGPE